MRSIDLLKAISFIDDAYVEEALSYREGRKRRVKGRFSPTVYIKRAAVIILAVIPVTFGLLMLDDGIRATVVNTVMTWYDKYVQFDFSKSTEAPKTEGETEGETEDETEGRVEITDFTQLEIGYVPEGFELSDHSEDSFYSEYLYFSETGGYMLIGIYTSESSDLLVDTENLKYEKMTVNGYEAYFFFDDTDYTGVLTFGNQYFYVLVSTSGIPREEVLKVGENIK